MPPRMCSPGVGGRKRYPEINTCVVYSDFTTSNMNSMRCLGTKFYYWYTNAIIFNF
jgi:hypothetical protein